MKRVLASLGVAMVLAACGASLGQAETPQQALSAAAQRSSQLKSAKFDLSGHVSMTLPAQLQQSLGGAASSGSFAVDITGTGEAQFPDREHMTMAVKTQGFSVTTEVIVANGKAYVKNPVTGKWQASAQTPGFSSQVGSADPLSINQFLKNVKSIKDLGDTTIDGTSVHHYLITPDAQKLANSLSQIKNPQYADAVRQVLNSGSMTIEVWFGTGDHLVRRVSLDMDYSVDLGQLFGSLGSSSGLQMPAGSAIHATSQILINFHDFDAPVTISVPPVG